MPGEREKSVSFIRSINIDLEAKAITVHATDHSAARFTLSPHGVIFEHFPQSEALAAPASTTAELPATAAPEKERAITLSGKLKSQPREGRPDSAGNPTAWGRFAAHEETPDGKSQAHMFLATFHGDNRAIALRLGVDTPLEVKGFPRPTTEQGKLDGLSVVEIIRIGDTPQRRQ